MTEAEWLACTDSDALFDHLTFRKVSPRKKRLLACGCCRLIWDQLEERSRAAVAVSERFADGYADLWELVRAAARATRVWEESERRLHEWDRGRTIHSHPRTPEEAANASQWHGLFHATQAAGAARYASSVQMDRQGEHPLDEDDEIDLAFNRNARMAHYWQGPRSASTAAFFAQRGRPVEWPTLPLLRDVFDNPFRQPNVDSAWLAWNGGMVVNLARAIYDAGRFTDLPILADALEEAGGGDETILAHCRGPGPHVRGCWVVDLVLGKE
jgi:hypothetical protein